MRCKTKGGIQGWSYMALAAIATGDDALLVIRLVHVQLMVPLQGLAVSQKEQHDSVHKADSA